MTDLKDRNDLKRSDELIEKAISTIEECSMLERGSKILIALSGGKDSVCLTDILSKISEKYGISLGACHLNHMIRGEEALRDEGFSRKLCEGYGIEFFAKRVDIPKKAKDEKKSVEEAARDARYEFFGELSEKHGFDRIATAHTLSDQCETVLFNMIRGKGLISVSGIPAVRDLSASSDKNGVKLIRPIISLTTDEVMEYVRINSLPYVTDSTNNDTVYARNLIRHEIIPRMKRLNPSFEKSIRELTVEAENYHGLIKDECDAVFEDNIDIGGSGFALLSPAVSLAADENRRAVLYEYLFRMLPKEKASSLTRERFEAIRDLLLKIQRDKASHIGKEIVLGNGIVCVFERETFGFIEKEHNSRSRGKNTDISFPGVSDVGDDEEKRIPISFGENDISFAECIISAEKCTFFDVPEKTDKKSMTIYVDLEIMNRGLYVRMRKNGDKVVYGGMSHSIKNILAEAGVPSHKRNSVPVLCDSEGIVWVPGGTVCDRCNPLRSDGKDKASDESLVKITYIIKAQP
ncbi:MAG: tRNA lysidine(34) synthetase TilS [Ruminococcaceae bacterium]|nr:tRNA lysidine(34) synthetase TilS [Oscillospiraceae bacterium]